MTTLDDRFEVHEDMSGAVTIRVSEAYGGGSGYGCSRPRFEVVVAERTGADGTATRDITVDLGNGDSAWSFDSTAEACHFATVLQNVMDDHLAAAREEGRREAVRLLRGARVVNNTVTLVPHFDGPMLDRAVADALARLGIVTERAR